ncbi:MAG: IS110 family transposase [Actinomycetota bacterium]|nr:IS110 family transposase [Actinomycetota bacterium]
MTIVADAPPAVDALEVTAGVDTHADNHVAAVIDPLGRHLGDRSFPATPAGYRDLAAWMATHGTVVLVGVEGTGTYGAGLTRALSATGSPWSRSTGRIARPAAIRASLTPSMPTPQLGRRPVAGPAVAPRPAPAMSSPSAPCGSLAAGP